MSSFNNRVLVASLFLPMTTASTIHDEDPFASGYDSRLDEKITHPTLKSISENPPVASPTSPRSAEFNFSSGTKHRVGIPKPKSIVDDLTSKSKSPTSPKFPLKFERSNVFGSFVNVPTTETEPPKSPPVHSPRPLLDPDSALADGTSTPPTPTQSGSGSMHRRLSRKQSRSSIITRDTPHTPWEVELNPSANGSLHNAVASVDHLCKRGTRWVGVLGPSTDDIAPDAREEITKTLLSKASSVPVWISDAEFSGGYDIYCHQVLWPSLHYILPHRPKGTSGYESSSFAQYKAINERFAERIVGVYEPGDIRVNDYHLLLLPQLLRAKLPHATIGFFLHVAFPSSEIFRCLADRKKLLWGMLGADLIGFQTQSYARHFRQSVFRVLGLEATPKGIVLENGFVHVSVFPIGIDVQGLTVKRRDPDVAEWVHSLRELYPGMKMIVARDKLDEVQGVRQKFLAFERFLEENPEFHGNVMLIQVALSTSETNELQGSVADVVSRINSKFSTLTYQPIIFFYTHDLTFSQYLALLTVADTFMVTSLREGMALRSHEFVECQEERKRPLILSEFTGSYTSGFKSCIPINPWDTRQTAEAMRQALCMSDEEAATRWKALHAHVNNQTAQKFVTDFITRCVRVNYKHHVRDTLVIPELDPVVIEEKYQAASRRLILIDLEKTMWKVEPRPSQKQVFEVPTETVELLKKIAVGNEVWALSGLPVAGRLESIAREIPNIGICAEHGCFVKPPGESQWISLIEGFSLDWMDACMDILNYFTERTPGSFIETRQATIIWRFWTGDSNNPDDEAWARRQATEAQNHIFDTFAEQLRIVPSANSFFITPRIIGRVTAVNAILDPSLLNRGSPKEPYKQDAADDEVHAGRFDLILTVGSDESLINRVRRLPNAETIYTGSRKSGASWRLDPVNLYPVLEQIIGCSGRSGS